MIAIPGFAAYIVATALIQGSAEQSPESAVKTELSRLETVWNKAHERGDAEELDRLWADDFVATVPGMASMTKDQSIAIWRLGKMRFKRYKTSDLRVRVYGDAAVVTGRLERTRTVGGRDVDDDWQFTKVYISSQGNWRVVAFHASAASPRKPLK